LNCHFRETHTWFHPSDELLYVKTTRLHTRIERGMGNRVRYAGTAP
jgi:hypothetical protein